MAKKFSFNEQEQHIMINNDVREDGTLIDNKSKNNFTIINKAGLDINLVTGKRTFIRNYRYNR